MAEIDDALSDCSTHHRDTAERDVDYLTEAQTNALLAAAAPSTRNTLIIRLLLTTGLRRRGVVNIRLCDVARWNESTLVWEVDKAGETLEKGSKRRTFPLFHEVQELIDRWVNGRGPDCRPASPSSYLFPSATTNNGQMSPETLRHIFKAICRKANLPHRLCHVHVMRHTCAHRLVEMGNTARQIAAYLGHASSSTTERFYLRDNVENITRDMVKPSQWTGVAAGSEKKRVVVQPPGEQPHKKQRRSPSVDVLKQVIALREERNRALQEKSG